MVVDKLTGVTTIVVHRYPNSPCPDGVASALILRDALTLLHTRRYDEERERLPSVGLEVQFVCHGDDLQQIAAKPGMIFCDICPPFERAQEFLALGTIVLDHHKDQEENVRLYGERGVFASEGEAGVSGAVLAYREVFAPILESMSFYDTGRALQVAGLVGVYDTYQRNDARWKVASEYAAALAFVPWSRWPLHVSACEALIREWGPILIEKQAEQVRTLIDQVARFVTKGGIRVAIVPACNLITQVADDLLSRVGGEDLVLGFEFCSTAGSHRMRISSRSRTYDCNKLMKRLGASSLTKMVTAGGHTGAAGGEVIIGRDEWDPYSLLQRLVESYESDR